MTNGLQRDEAVLAVTLVWLDVVERGGEGFSISTQALSDIARCA